MGGPHHRDGAPRDIFDPVICIAGKNEIAVSVMLEALKTYGARRICACPNRSDLGGPSWQPSLRRFAQEFGVGIVDLADVEPVEDLVLVSLEFDRIIRTKRFKSKRVYNIHFSLLPAYKGVYTAAWPILNNESQSGVTLHCMDHGIDTGDIIDQRAFPIEPTWTARDLYLECMATGTGLVLQWLPNLVDGIVAGRTQSAAGSSYYGRSSIDYSKITIDFRATAAQVQRQLRAFHFREFQIPSIDEFPVGRAEILTIRSTLPPGQLVAGQPTTRQYATIDFDVLLHRDRSGDYFDLVDREDAAGIRSYSHHDCDVESRNNMGWTPLMVAAYSGLSSVCEALLERGASPNATNPNGTTALMYAKDQAMSSGDTSVFELLLAHGADPKVRDRFGRSLLDYLGSATAGTAADLARIAQAL
jgi:methionyl-tRNA formyltransferase